MAPASLARRWMSAGSLRSAAMKRAVPLSLSNYMLGWTLNQHYALQVAKRFPDRFHLVRVILQTPQFFWIPSISKAIPRASMLESTAR